MEFQIKCVTVTLAGKWTEKQSKPQCHFVNSTLLLTIDATALHSPVKTTPRKFENIHHHFRLLTLKDLLWVPPSLTSEKEVTILIQRSNTRSPTFGRRHHDTIFPTFGRRQTDDRIVRFFLLATKCKIRFCRRRSPIISDPTRFYKNKSISSIQELAKTFYSLSQPLTLISPKQVSLSLRHSLLFAWNIGTALHLRFLAGVVNDLPVPILLRRDFRCFLRTWCTIEPNSLASFL